MVELNLYKILKLEKMQALEQLRKKHDAILIATGVYKAREVELPGND